MARSDDPIDQVIAEASKNRGGMPLEEQLSSRSVDRSTASYAAIPKRRRNVNAAVFAALIVAAVAVFGIIAFGWMFRTPTPAEIAARERDQFRLAAEGLIKQNLPSPATAVFAPADEWTFAEISPKTQRMQGWVDSENVFSALLRDQFTVIVTRERSGDWKLQYLKLNEKRPPFGSYLHTPAEIAQSERELAAKMRAFDEEQKRKADEAARIAAEAKAAEDAAWQRQREQLDDLRERAAEIDRQRAQRKSSK